MRVLCALWLIGLAAGCGREPKIAGGTHPGGADATAAPPASIGSIADTSAAGMLEMLRGDYQTNTGYRDWTADTLHQEKTLNAFVRTFANDPMVAAAKQKGATQPVGSIGVLELYSDAQGTNLTGWAVLAKAVDGDGPDAWFAYEQMAAPGGGMSVPTVNGMGDGDCGSCHVPAPSYVIAPTVWQVSR